MSQVNKKSAESVEIEKLTKLSEEINSHSNDVLRDVPVKEVEAQTKLSQNELRNAKDIYLKPKKTINSKEKFNEDFRSQYNFSKEYVYFIAEHKECIGEEIDIWTKPFPGMPAEEWMVPTNKPIWGPRYLAEQISKKSYNRLVMNAPDASPHHIHGEMLGRITVETKIKRLDAYPATTSRSVFMGSKGF